MAFSFLVQSNVVFGLNVDATQTPFKPTYLLGDLIMRYFLALGKFFIQKKRVF